VKQAWIVGIFMIYWSQIGWALGPHAVESNKDGIKSYSQEQYLEAFRDFTSALGADPFNPQLHLNLGDSFFKGGEYDKAIASYLAAAGQPKATPELKAQAYFNAGNAALQQKKIAEALKFYQQALENSPGNPMIKTNIELALQQQQGGGNGGDQEQENKKDEDKNKQGQGGQDRKNQQPEPKPKPQPFKSQDLTESDVRRIMEELKRQEQSTRAKQYDNKQTKQEKPAKDW